MKKRILIKNNKCDANHQKFDMEVLILPIKCIIKLEIEEI
tara:strand:- start:499 stop:618 length:120 start_codon:yes stop_codon:yes gene_type:complete